MSTQPDREGWWWWKSTGNAGPMRPQFVERRSDGQLVVLGADRVYALVDDDRFEWGARIPGPEEFRGFDGLPDEALLHMRSDASLAHELILQERKACMLLESTGIVAAPIGETGRRDMIGALQRALDELSRVRVSMEDTTTAREQALAIIVHDEIIALRDDHARVVGDRDRQMNLRNEAEDERDAARAEVATLRERLKAAEWLAEERDAEHLRATRALEAEGCGADDLEIGMDRLRAKYRRNAAAQPVRERDESGPAPGFVAKDHGYYREGTSTREGTWIIWRREHGYAPPTEPAAPPSLTDADRGWLLDTLRAIERGDDGWRDMARGALAALGVVQCTSVEPAAPGDATLREQVRSAAYAIRLDHDGDLPFIRGIDNLLALCNRLVNDAAAPGEPPGVPAERIDGEWYWARLKAREVDDGEASWLNDESWCPVLWDTIDDWPVKVPGNGFYASWVIEWGPHIPKHAAASAGEPPGYADPGADRPWCIAHDTAIPCGYCHDGMPAAGEAEPPGPGDARERKPDEEMYDGAYRLYNAERAGVVVSATHVDDGSPWTMEDARAIVEKHAAMVLAAAAGSPPETQPWQAKVVDAVDALEAALLDAFAPESLGADTDVGRAWAALDSAVTAGSPPETQPDRPHKLTWNGAEWVAPCGCRYHPDDDNGSHGGAPHVHRCETHAAAPPETQGPGEAKEPDTDVDGDGVEHCTVCAEDRPLCTCTRCEFCSARHRQDDDGAGDRDGARAAAGDRADAPRHRQPSR